jgi:hypothetical protein
VVSWRRWAAADGVGRGQRNPGTPAAGARAIHTDRQAQGAGACASDRGRGLSAPPFPLALSCPAQLRDGDDGDAPRETVFLQLSRDGAGWHGETDNMHIDTLHSSATPRALRLSPLIQLPLLLLLLSRSPPPGAAGRSHPPTMPAAPLLHNHATLTAHPKHTSCANCALIQPHTRQLASERSPDSRAVR